jgi:hypothetical protein
LLVQSRQFRPQAVAVPCVSHDPLAAQHVPPPQVPSPAAPHAELHAPPVAVGVHVGVDVPLTHAVHAVPWSPHAPLATPVTQVALRGSQQPPLHAVSDVAPHFCVQVCDDVSHA